MLRPLVCLLLAGLAQPAFDTASVNRSAPDTTARSGARLRPNGGFEASNMTLRELVAFAYQRHGFDRREIVGGPAWLDSDRFDIVATVAGEHVIDADGVPRQTWSMLRALLERRFALRAHEEPRDRAVYLLEMATSERTLGAKIRKTDVDCGAVMRGPRTARPGGPVCGFKTPPGRIFAKTFTMPAIASLIERHLDRPVVDATGLDGRYDIELEAQEIKAAPDYKPGPSDLALPPPNGPSIFVAVREQLGLTLASKTAAVPVVVIDQAERPTPD